MSNEEAVTREILGNVPGWLVATFYAAVFLSCAVAATAFTRRHGKRRRGREARPSARPRRGLARRLADAIAYVTFHRELLRDPWPGIAHLLMFYGFVVLTVGTGLVGLEHDTPLHFLYGRFYLWMSLACDLGGLAFLVGLGLFLGRRAWPGPSRILREWWVASVAPAAGRDRGDRVRHWRPPGSPSRSRSSSGGASWDTGWRRPSTRPESTPSRPPGCTGPAGRATPSSASRSSPSCPGGSSRT